MNAAFSEENKNQGLRVPTRQEKNAKLYTWETAQWLGLRRILWGLPERLGVLGINGRSYGRARSPRYCLSVPPIA